MSEKMASSPDQFLGARIDVGKRRVVGHQSFQANHNDVISCSVFFKGAASEEPIVAPLRFSHESNGTNDMGIAPISNEGLAEGTMYYKLMNFERVTNSTLPMIGFYASAAAEIYVYYFQMTLSRPSLESQVWLYTITFYEECQQDAEH